MLPFIPTQMVNLDVVNLFTKVPTNETLATVQDKLATDPSLEERTCISVDNLIEMLTFCVKTTFFGMESDIYQQEECLAMGSPLSPVLANVYMEYFKVMALRSISLKPSMWLRYVDDTFLFWPHQEYVQALIDDVNSIHSSIQFTMEKEQDNKLSFLDVFITSTDQWFSASVYQKPTYSGQNLNFNSNHSYNIKKAIIHCL